MSNLHLGYVILKQAQIMNIAPPVRNVSIHDINLVLLRKKEHLSSRITGCTITPNADCIGCIIGMV
jgi:hypothetical protein